MAVDGKGRVMALALALLLGMAGCMAPLETGESDPEENVGTTHYAVSGGLPLAEIADRPDTDRTPATPRAAVYTGPTVSSVTPERRNYVQRYQQDNRDMVGWLVVPNTNIDHFIVQNPYERGNNYYLTHDFYGNTSKNGTFCADRRINFGSGTRSDLPRNITLYGHNWDDNADGQLFSQLLKYKDAYFAQNNPYIFFSTDSENMAWEVFAVMETTVELPYVQPNLPMDIYSQVLNVVYASSYYDYGVKITDSDRILSLSTCIFNVQGHPNMPQDMVNDYRFVIMARLVSPDEPLKDRASFTVNPNPLAPDRQPVIVAPGYQFEID